MLHKKLLTAIILLVLTATSLLAIFPFTVKAAVGVIAIDPSTTTVPARGNINLNFGNVTWTGVEFYLILSTNNNFSNPSGTAYSPAFMVAHLVENLVFDYAGPGGAWKVGSQWVNGSIPNVAAGSYYVKALDASNTSLAVTGSSFTVTAIEDDVTPPQTEIFLAGTSGENGWYTSDVLVTLSPSDESGILETRYSFDRLVGWQIYTDPFLIESEGRTTVYYNSTDTNLNVESTKTREVKIDRTPPTGTLLINEGEESTDTTEVTLTLSASDATSGITQLRFSNDGTQYGAWQSFKESVSWTLHDELGQKTVYVQFQDEAGLTSTSADSIELISQGAGGGFSLDSDVVIVAAVIVASIIGVIALSRLVLRGEPKAPSEEKGEMAKHPPPPLIPQPRYIQAQVYETPTNGKPRILRTNALRANAFHSLYVRIGPRDIAWLTPPLEKPAEFPEDLPWEEDEEELQVVFNEPNHSPEPQVKNIRLPRSGPSHACRFHFHTLETNNIFSGRIVVLHENRVLQTMLLGSYVVSNPDQVPDLRIDMNLESVVRKNLNNLSSRQKFDVAFVANHTEDGQHTLTTIASERATFCSLKSVETIIDDINKRLEKTVVDPKIYPINIFGEKFTDLIRYLSLRGNELYEGLIIDERLEDKTTNAKRIQLLTKRKDNLPLEFLYDRNPPDDDTPLCPNTKAALEKGDCTGCTLNDDTPANLICPLGFWFLKMVIERHLILDPTLKDEFGMDFEPLGDRNKLEVFRSALFAATSKANESTPGNTDRLFSIIQKASKKAASVKTWQEWEDAIKKEKPSLLILVTHSRKGGRYNLDQLEIGEGS